MRIGLAVILFLAMIMIIFGGCTAEQRARVDVIAARTQAVTETAQEVIASPGGAAIPEPGRSTAYLVTGGLAAIATAWLNARKHKNTAKRQRDYAKYEGKEAMRYRDALGEVAYAFKLFEAAGDEGNKQMQAAKAQALNPPTIELLNAA